MDILFGYHIQYEILFRFFIQAYGLSSLPIGLIKGNKATEQEYMEIEKRIQNNKSVYREDQYLLENENRFEISLSFICEKT